VCRPEKRLVDNCTGSYDFAIGHRYQALHRSRFDRPAPSCEHSRLADIPIEEQHIVHRDLGDEGRDGGIVDVGHWLDRNGRRGIRCMVHTLSPPTSFQR
jgi:hypothetical protein